LLISSLRFTSIPGGWREDSLQANLSDHAWAPWLEMLLQHVPYRGEHLVRCYGRHSNRVRGARNAETASLDTPDPVIEGIPEQVDPEVSRAARAA